MWQRFTERARKVILFAQEDAGKMKSAHVGTEHLLLGLVRQNEDVGAQILQVMGVDLEKVRREIELANQSDEVSDVPEPRLLPKARRVLEFAADEAQRLHHDYIGTEHLLLGLLREKDGLAAKVLYKLGLDLEKARRFVSNLYLGPDSPDNAPEPKLSDRLTPEAKYVSALAVDEASRMKHKEIDTGHLLLALLRENDGVAAKILSEAGLNLENVRERVAKEHGAE